MASWGRAEYVEAYEAGASIDDIALIAGKSYTTIRYHLLKAGVTLRSRAHPKTTHCEKGHERDDNHQCPCRYERVKERYHSDPEYRERRLAASRKWRQNRKKK